MESARVLTPEEVLQRMTGLEYKGTPLGALQDLGDSHEVVRAQRDAALARVAKLEAALRRVRPFAGEIAVLLGKSDAEGQEALAAYNMANAALDDADVKP